MELKYYRIDSSERRIGEYVKFFNKIIAKKLK